VVAVGTLAYHIEPEINLCYGKCYHAAKILIFFETACLLTQKATLYEK
jgi:hypothetical protein